MNEPMEWITDRETQTRGYKFTWCTKIRRRVAFRQRELGEHGEREDKKRRCQPVLLQDLSPLDGWQGSPCSSPHIRSG
jgi:hypothetical protein